MKQLEISTPNPHELTPPTETLCDMFQDITGNETLDIRDIQLQSFPCVAGGGKSFRIVSPDRTELSLETQSYDAVPNPQVFAHVALVPSEDVYHMGENFFDILAARGGKEEEPEHLRWHRLASVASDRGRITLRVYNTEEESDDFTTIDVPAGQEGIVNIVTFGNQWIIEGEIGTETHSPTLI